MDQRKLVCTVVFCVYHVWRPNTILPNRDRIPNYKTYSMENGSVVTCLNFTLSIFSWSPFNGSHCLGYFENILSFLSILTAILSISIERNEPIKCLNGERNINILPFASTFWKRKKGHSGIDDLDFGFDVVQQATNEHLPFSIIKITVKWVPGKWPGREKQRKNMKMRMK